VSEKLWLEVTKPEVAWFS